MTSTNPGKVTLKYFIHRGPVGVLACLDYGKSENITGYTPHQQTMIRHHFTRTLLPCRSSTRHCRLSTSAIMNNAAERSDFLNVFIRRHKPSRSAMDYFLSIPWTRKFIENDAYKAIPFFSRYLNEHTGENRFFARTVNTDTTIAHLLALQQKDLRTPEHQPLALSPTELTTHPEIICLMSLGRGLESHPSIVHGGFQAVIFDEIMRMLVLLHQNNICKPGPRDVHFTVNMTLSYSAPLNAPSTVLVRSQLAKREGRKWLAKAEIVNSDNHVLTSAESLWVTAANHSR